MTSGDLFILLWVVVTFRVTMLLVRLIGAKSDESAQESWDACLLAKYK